MAEEKANPHRGQRSLARYRFEYERKRSVGKAVLAGVAGACVIGTMIGVTALRGSREEPPAYAAAAPDRIAPAAKPEPPRAMVMSAPEPAATAQPSSPPAPVAVAAVTAPPATARPVEAVAGPPAKAPAAITAAPATPPPMPVARPEPAPVLLAAAEPGPAAVPVVAAPAPPARQDPIVQSAADPCAILGGAVERMVCADAELRAADGRVAAAFRLARQVARDPAALDRQHERWRERRDALGPDRAAVLSHYERRYRELWPDQRRYPARIGAQLPGVIPRF